MRMEYYITPVTSVAQLVERPTEKPGAILTRGRVPSAAKDFSPRVNFLCRLCYVRCPYSPPPPPPPIACINICAHVKNPETLAAVFIYHFWTHKNTAHNDRNRGGAVRLSKYVCVSLLLRLLYFTQIYAVLRSREVSLRSHVIVQLFPVRDNKVRFKIYIKKF